MKTKLTIFLTLLRELINQNLKLTGIECRSFLKGLSITENEV